mmetsp:Transcript_15368/g.17876  ORF Transcript_15368/g.17876 Transcript_15368/m.17876 type:complete len:378 (+) Transcript_15368:137-1270(+)
MKLIVFQAALHIHISKWSTCSYLLLLGLLGLCTSLSVDVPKQRSMTFVNRLGTSGSRLNMKSYFSNLSENGDDYNSFRCIRCKPLPPNEASTAIDEILFLEKEYRQRLEIARNAQFDDDGGGGVGEIMSASDPRLTFTYEEFPMESMEQLVQLAIQEYKQLHKTLTNDADDEDTQQQPQQPTNFVDLGSGCGRLVLYAALCRNQDHASSEITSTSTYSYPFAFQHVHGIEITQALHDIGISSLEKGIEKGLFSLPPDDNDNDNTIGIDAVHVDHDHEPTVTLHLGPANELSSVLNQADIIFSYSTVFPTKGFDPDLGAMILSKEWSQMLAQHCKKDCVVITTDRALDPVYGWELMHKLDVDNPKLFGSTGYVSILRK